MMGYKSTLPLRFKEQAEIVAEAKKRKYESVSIVTEADGYSVRFGEKKAPKIPK